MKLYLGGLRVEYKIIPDFKNYAADIEGTIWSFRNGINRLKQSKQENGYLKVNLCKNRITYTRLVHRLVLDTFVGPCPDGLECRHLDGNKLNVSLSNLKWGTHKENESDKEKHGAVLRGSRAGSSKLDEKTVLEIRKLYHEEGISYSKLGYMFEVNKSTICFIITRRTWKHI